MTAPPPIIITDLDRTFTDTRLRPVPAALEAMRAARKEGLTTILATGRTLPELERKRGLLAVFDYVIAEGGGLLGVPGAVHPLKPGIHHLERLHLWLNERGILHERGVTSLSFARADLTLVKTYAALHRFQVTPNRNRADLTLRGVDKGTAIQTLRRVAALRGRQAIGFGDGENDVALFRAVDRRVAVRNAVPALRRIADDVTHLPGGRGLAQYVHEHVLGHHRAIKEKRRMDAAWTRSSNSKTSPRSSAAATAKRSPRSTTSR